MSLMVMSDLHLHDEHQPYGFNEAKEKVFVSLVDEALSTDSTLLLAGDVFDLTGMLPPRAGLAEFFEELLGAGAMNEPQLVEMTRVRPLEDRLRAIQSRFPSFFKALALAASKEKLILLPGNHDCELRSPEGASALAHLLGTPRTGIHPDSQVRYGDFAIAAHGHEFDPPNETASGCLNPGASITAALYRGLVPALPYFGMPEDAVAAIPAVRPEEAVVKGILHYLGPKQGKKVIIALVRLLDRSGYFRGISRYPIHLLNHPVPLVSAAVRAFITPSRLIHALPTDEDLKAIGRRGATKLREKGKIIVLGHTHVVDGDDEYVNLGTWIDHVCGLLPEDLKNADTSLPVLRIDVDNRAELRNAGNQRVLWTSVGASGPRRAGLGY